MTVLENLEMGAYIERDARAHPATALERVYALFPILGERRRQKAGTMSGGEQQMVAIGRALMTTPEARSCSTSRRSAWRPSSSR